MTGSPLIILLPTILRKLTVLTFNTQYSAQSTGCMALRCFVHTMYISPLYIMFLTLGVMVIICAQFSAIPICRHLRVFLVCLDRSSSAVLLLHSVKKCPSSTESPEFCRLKRCRCPQNVFPVCGPHLQLFPLSSVRVLSACEDRSATTNAALRNRALVT